MSEDSEERGTTDPRPTSWCSRVVGARRGRPAQRLGRRDRCRSGHRIHTYGTMLRITRFGFITPIEATPTPDLAVP